MNKVKRAKEFSILLDSSVDTGKIDELSVFVCTINEDTGEKDCDLLTFIPINSQKSEDIYKDVINLFRKKGLLENLKNNSIGIGVDGAANMLGDKSGFAKRIQTYVNRFLMRHQCLCHVMSLSCNFDNVTATLADKLEGTLKNVCGDFSRSSLNTHEFKTLCTILQSAQLKIIRYCATR